ncbi:MAG TPA: hypothetical protein DCQ77_05190 [Betaproteobacteria bacterium]|nr:hypothetical protein [Betaproteobacteria bacterium]
MSDNDAKTPGDTPRRAAPLATDQRALTALRKMGWDERDLPPGVQKSAMKTLSALMMDADEIVSF